MEKKTTATNSAKKRTSPIKKTGKKLVIVESPAKAKTIKKYLGGDYEVLASYGHVRDLLPKKGAVDPNNDFAMSYINVEKNEKHIQAIASALKKADTLLLATDPDREGEAIAWAIAEIMKEKHLLDNRTVSRIVFNQITKKAVQEAANNPRDLNMALVEAQQGRRALDYLVGFELSPLLWKKIKPSLSAGRVQSPALRLIVEREEEIERFVSQAYWTIKANLAAEKKTHFSAKLIQYEKTKVEQFSFTAAETAETVKNTLIQQAAGTLTVHKIEQKQKKRNPTPPFTTSTLQQEAARKLGFTAQRTMRTAQQLYEGIETNEGTVGLITYMRTDSVNLAEEAITEMRDYIQTEYGKDYLPEQANQYKTKSKNAQEAHEAIRPTAILRDPDSLKATLTPEQHKLYTLIWKRALASQMIYATLNTVSIDLACGTTDNLFRANGQTILHPGFITLYQEDQDDQKKTDDDRLLPPLNEGDKVTLLKILTEDHKTEPPPRYSEASLVKTLEEYGIGRPSTYASIISTLQQRAYVRLDKKRFFPTDIGRIVNKFLSQYFTQYVDYHFTAQLEDELDAIARNETQRVPVLQKFWAPFIAKIKEIDASVTKENVTTEDYGENCPECNHPLLIRLGRAGRFVGCSHYPECKYTRNLDSEGDENTAEILKDRECPSCKAPLQIKTGRYGKFIGCSQYPNCRHIEPLEKPENTQVRCPSCHQGNLLKRKSRYGKIFYSCERYPDCTYAIWYAPIDQPCPSCRWPITMLRITKRFGTQRACPQKNCKFLEPYEIENENGDNGNP